MKLSDTYTITNDTKQWILQTQTGTITKPESKNYGEPTYSYSYFATLNQVANKVAMDLTAKQNMDNLLTEYNKLVLAITNQLEEMK